MDNYQTAWAEARERYDSGWKPSKLLGDNTKLIKAEKFGMRGLGLSLAPADVSGHEVCASRSVECTKHCIFSSGRGIFQKTAMARIFRTIWFFQDRASFMEKLVREIANNQDAAIRLNVFSDWMWERQSVDISESLAQRYQLEAGRHPNLMSVFPQVQFYDYTKHFKRMFRDRPQNYHLTFSLHENNGHQARQVLANGMNVAAVTSSMQGTLFGFPVIDGDDHDLRFLDPSPVVVGLAAKGSLKTSDQKDFVYDPSQFEVPEAA